MASAGNIGLVRLPWGKLPRSPVSSRVAGTSQLEMSFQDIMAEQERETRTPDKEIEGFVQLPTPGDNLKGKEEQDIDDRMIMSLYEDQDFEDAAYEISEQELDEMADDDTDNYYEGLAKKLSTVVEIQSPNRSNKGNRTSSGGSGGSIRQTDPDSVIDVKSKVILEKLKRKGVIREPVSSSSIDKVIHVGQAATVMYALGGMLKKRDDSSKSSLSIVKLRLSKECAVKVFKDNQRPVKEMTYLNRMARAGIPCPQVQFLCGNILVTDFLGKDGLSAKKLKHVNDLSSSRSILKSAYEQVTNNMKTLFKSCHLVHGDLSEENILWHKRQAYFIGIGEAATNSNNPKALDFLYQDCVNISQFFEKKGSIGSRQPHQLFQWITGFDYAGKLHQDIVSSFDDEHEDFTIV